MIEKKQICEKPFCMALFHLLNKQNSEKLQGKIFVKFSGSLKWSELQSRKMWFAGIAGFQCWETIMVFIAMIFSATTRTMFSVDISGPVKPVFTLALTSSAETSSIDVTLTKYSDGTNVNHAISRNNEVVKTLTTGEGARFIDGENVFTQWIREKSNVWKSVCFCISRQCISINELQIDKISTVDFLIVPLIEKISAQSCESS